MYKKAAFLALCFFFYTFGYIFSNGFYHIGELFVLLCVLALLTAFYFRSQILSRTIIPDSPDLFKFIISLVLLADVVIVGARLGDAAQTNWMVFSLLNRFLAFFALTIALSTFVNKLPQFITRYRFPLLFFIAILIRIFAIASAPNPTIDVFYILRDGPRLLLNAINPYTLDYPSPYGVYNPTINFAYGPLALFLFLPSDFLFFDPRFTLVVFDILSAFLIYKIGKILAVPKDLLNILIGIFLFHPLFPFMIEQSWIDPVIFSFLTLSVYLHLKNKKILSSTVLGAILAIKAVYILPLLLLINKLKGNLKNFAAFFIFPAIMTLPFFLMGPELFVKRTLVDAGAIQSYPRLTISSLNLSAVFLKYFHLVIPFYTVTLLSVLFAAILIKKKGTGINPGLQSMFLMFFFMFMIAPFVVLNYFSFLGNILLLILLTALGSQRGNTKLTN